MAEVVKSNKIIVDDFLAFKNNVFEPIDQRFLKLPEQLASSETMEKIEGGLKAESESEIEKDLKSGQPVPR